MSCCTGGDRGYLVILTAANREIDIGRSSRRKLCSQFSLQSFLSLPLQHSPKCILLKKVLVEKFPDHPVIFLYKLLCNIYIYMYISPHTGKTWPAVCQ